MSRIGLVSLVVRDYDEAITYYRDALGFRLIEDTPLEKGKRWVVVAPDDGAGTGLWARAYGERRPEDTDRESKRWTRLYVPLHR